MGKVIDLTGKRFGKWIAIECVGRNKSGGAMWECKCDCGAVKNVDGRSLRNGSSTCCGCERKNMDFRRNVKHGWSIERALLEKNNHAKQ